MAQDALRIANHQSHGLMRRNPLASTWELFFGGLLFGSDSEAKIAMYSLCQKIKKSLRGKSLRKGFGVSCL
jgi:hypothetical protein